MRGARVAVALGVIASLLGCGKAPRAEQSGLVLAAAPQELPLRLGIEFGGAVELVGAKLEPAAGFKRGGRVELTLYWQKHASVAAGFRLFTHVLDEAGERILNLDSVGPLRAASGGKPQLPPSAWDEQLVYVDKQAFTVPYSIRTDSLRIVAGLFRGDERLPVTRGARREHGQKAANDRGLVARLPIERPAVSMSVPMLWAPRRLDSQPIVIDGRLDEAAWGGAASTGQFVNVATGDAPAAAEVSGSAKLLFDDQALYIGFDVMDEDLRGGFDPAQPDPHLWTKDTVEVMLDPDGDGDNLDYYEIQVGPQNLVFDSQFDAYNEPKVEPNGPFGHQEWSAQLSSAVELRGTLDDAREDDGYAVEIAIPWSAFSKAKHSPPRLDDIWRMNLYAIQNNAGAAWSPILGKGNFHLASRFGRVRFGK